MGYRNYGPSNGFVVAKDGNGDFKTIATALTAATSGTTIFIRPGTYTENITLKAGVNLTAYGGDGLTTTLASAGGTSNVTIVGTVTVTYTGCASLCGIQLQTNSAAALASSGTANAELFITGCTINAANSTAITLNNANLFVTFTNCYFISSSTNLLFAVTAGPIDWEFCIFALSATASSSTVAASNMLFNGCDMEGLNITTSTTGTVTAVGCYWQYGANTLLTTAGTGTSTISNCLMLSTSASTISVGTGTTVDLYNSTISSSNTNAITGAGTIVYGGVVFSGTSSTINTTTQTPIPWPVKQGGTGAATLTGLLTGNGTSAFTGTAITQYNVITGGATNLPNSVAPSATSGVPLISQGSSSQPVFGTAVVAGGGTGIVSATSYAPLCGGTSTTGAFQSASTGISTSGYVFTSTGASTLPSFQAIPAASGGLVYIQQLTASSSASLSFTTGISSTYTNYLFVISNIISASSSVTFGMQFSTNGGSSYLSSNYISGNFTLAYTATTLSNSNSTSNIILTGGVTSTDTGLSGTLWCYGITTASQPNCTYDMTWKNSSSSSARLFGGGNNTTTAGVNAFQFAFSSGNIASGTITLYGLAT